MEELGLVICALRLPPECKAVKAANKGDAMAYHQHLTGKFMNHANCTR